MSVFCVISRHLVEARVTDRDKLPDMEAATMVPNTLFFDGIMLSSPNGAYSAYFYDRSFKNRRWPNIWVERAKSSILEILSVQIDC